MLKKLEKVFLFRPAGPRGLTGGEIALLGEVFGDDLDYDRICLVESRMANVARRSFRWWSRIRFATIHYREDFTAIDKSLTADDIRLHALLVHEVMHEWQAQHHSLTGYTTFKAALEHMTGRNPYLYTAQPGKTLLDFRFEQQAKMVQDLYLALHGLNPYGPREWKKDSLSSLRKIVFEARDFPWGGNRDSVSI